MDAGITWDTLTPGFGVKVSNTRKTFFLYYRTQAGEQRKPSIGHVSMGVSPARKIAKEWLSQIAAGRDPSHERKELRASPTLSEISADYLKAKEPFKKSISKDVANLSNHIVPKLGHRKIAVLTRREIALFHIQFRETPVLANRLLSLLSAIFKFAEQMEIRPVGSNPCRIIPKFRERKIHRDLSPKQLEALSSSLERATTKHPDGTALIRALLLTGCRRSELVDLRWEEVDLEHNLLRLAESKTGAKEIHLSTSAADVIKGQTGRHPEVVFPSPKGKTIKGIFPIWNSIRKEAGIPSFRIHDLRHNFAAVAITNGASLSVVGKLLGHSNPSTTQRYAVLADDAARATAQAVGYVLTKRSNENKL